MVIFKRGCWPAAGLRDEKPKLMISEEGATMTTHGGWADYFKGILVSPWRTCRHQLQCGSSFLGPDSA